MSQSPPRIWSNRLLATLIILILVSLTVGVLTTATAASAVQNANTDQNVTEEAYIEAAPEPGDDYFEAQASDGRWVSYHNPRDEYKDPYVGEGSGKICTVLLNEAGEPIVGKTVPNTTVTVPTGDTLDWHSSADPMTVNYPLTENYNRPLDADQFGHSETVAQGDGYMDSHCIEFHGPAIGEEIEYGEITVDGDHADRIELVGYIQKTNTWNTDIDPVEAATSYEDAGGSWTYRESASHGQVVIVLQLTGDGLNSTDNDGVDNESQDNNQTANGSAPGDTDNATNTNSSTEEVPGFGIVGAIVGILSLVIGALVRHR